MILVYDIFGKKFNVWYKNETHWGALFVRDKVLNGKIEMKQFKTNEQVLDMLTKGLGGTTFSKLQGQFGLCKKFGAKGEVEKHHQLSRKF